MEILYLVFFSITIIILSGIVSGSEAALLSISYTKAKEILNKSKTKKRKEKAKKLILIKENIQNYIITIVVLNNVINIIGSIYIGILSSRIFGDIYVGIISGILTFLIILFSEIIPKIYGEKNCVKISLRVSGPLIFLTKLLFPINFLLNKLSKFFVKEKTASKVSEGEIKEMAKLGLKEGSINTYEEDVIKNVFRMDDIETYNIMVPKSKVVSFETNVKYDEIIKIIEKTGFTRFPITKNGEVIGLINVKDLFKFSKNKKYFKISKIIRPIIFAPESMKIFSLEQKLKKNRIHMAAIINEHGDFVGIVTLEDIIEELLGEIEDEFDEEEGFVKEIKTGKYLLKGETDIEFLNERIGLNLPIDKGDFTTLNGYIINKLEKIPKVNERIKINEGTFRILNATKKKVLRVEFKKNNKYL